MKERNAYVLSHRLCKDVCYIIDDFIGSELNFSNMREYILEHGNITSDTVTIKFLFNKIVRERYGITRKHPTGYRITLPKNIIIFGKHHKLGIESFGPKEVKCVLFPKVIALMDVSYNDYVRFQNIGDDKNQFTITYG